jgi:hypothetical protein
MTARITHKVERKGGGMRRWMFAEPYYSDIDGQRFLTRFVFWFTPFGGCHVTRIHMADDQREHPHDHTRTFISIKLAGGYEEDVYSGDIASPDRRHRKHRWLSWHVMPYDQAHSITAVRPLTVTLLFLGRHRHGSGYWTPDGKVPLGMPVDEWS